MDRIMIRYRIIRASSDDKRFERKYATLRKILSHDDWESTNFFISTTNFVRVVFSLKWWDSVQIRRTRLSFISNARWFSVDKSFRQFWTAIPCSISPDAGFRLTWIDRYFGSLASSLRMSEWNIWITTRRIINYRKFWMPKHVCTTFFHDPWYVCRFPYLESGNSSTQGSHHIQKECCCSPSWIHQLTNVWLHAIAVLIKIWIDWR